MENLEDVLNPNQPNDNKPLEENNEPIVDDLDDDIGGNLNINGEIDRKNPDGVPKNLSAQDNQRPNPHGKRPEDVRAPQNNNIVNNQNNQNNNNNNIVNDQNNQNNNNNNNNNNDNIVNNPNNQNNNNNNPGGEEINNNQNNGNGNNGEAGDRNEENREVDRRQQEANPNNEIDDVELGENENVIRRSNSFVGRNENNRRRQVNYNPLAPDEAVLDELPDIGKETRLVTDALAKERERLRKERERIEIEKARLKVERAKLEEEKKKLAAAQAKKKSTNTKYKKTIKSDEKTAEKRGYKIGEIKDGVTRSQSKKVNGLKHLVMDMDKKFRSSPEYRGVKSSLKEFDEFMKSISGRTRLTSAEMEMYDKLSLKCYNATTTYLNKKVDERTVDIDSEEAKDAIDVNGEKLSPKNEHERVRITQAKEIKNSLDEMRKEMFKAQLDFKTKEMEKKCQNALEQEEKNRGDLLTNKMSDEELKTAMTESVAKTLFYSTRMDHLKKSGKLDLNSGESFVNGFKRLDKLTEPRPQDMAQNSEDPNFQKIVQAGVDAIKSGKAFTGENIKEMFKQQAIEESNKKIEEKRRVENMKNPAEIKKNENERQLQNPHP